MPNKFFGNKSNSKTDWETPLDFFTPINEEFKFTLDASATKKNSKVPGSFISKEEDGLKQSWGEHTVWLNPPYGDRSSPLWKWVNKAFIESLQGATVVVLVPVYTNTDWFHDFCLAKGEVRFVRGRVKFVGATYGLPLPLCLVIFRPPPGLKKRLNKRVNVKQYGEVKCQ